MEPINWSLVATAAAKANDVSLREMMNDVAFGNDAFPWETFWKKTFGFQFYLN